MALGSFHVPCSTGRIPVRTVALPRNHHIRIPGATRHGLCGRAAAVITERAVFNRQVAIHRRTSHPGPSGGLDGRNDGNDQQRHESIHGKFHSKGILDRIRNDLFCFIRIELLVCFDYIFYDRMAMFYYFYGENEQRSTGKQVLPGGSIRRGHCCMKQKNIRLRYAVFVDNFFTHTNSRYCTEYSTASSNRHNGRKRYGLCTTNANSKIQIQKCDHHISLGATQR